MKKKLILSTYLLLVLITSPTNTLAQKSTDAIHDYNIKYSNNIKREMSILNKNDSNSLVGIIGDSHMTKSKRIAAIRLLSINSSKDLIPKLDALLADLDNQKKTSEITLYEWADISSAIGVAATEIEIKGKTFKMQIPLLIGMLDNPHRPVYTVIAKIIKGHENDPEYIAVLDNAYKTGNEKVKEMVLYALTVSESNYLNKFCEYALNDPSISLKRSAIFDMSRYDRARALSLLEKLDKELPPNDEMRRGIKADKELIISGYDPHKDFYIENPVEY